ncbi:hypothetical protein QBC45DRAFT_160142 [Copromyces sp. CBS 386.78]|nr:hypothetical protein QBC45DRAFT_160142 [Copromyces sp. CBS 386.78]
MERTIGAVGLRWVAFFALLLCHQVHAFYIPGWSVKSYKEDEAIPLLVNKVYSDNTQLQYAYYDLPFVCPPTGEHKFGGLLSGQSIPLNLGEVLRGDRIKVSDMELRMKHDSECNFVCNREITRKELKRARQLVRDGYVVEWIVDNLPGATSFVTVDTTRKYYAAGFKLGYTDLSSGRPRYYLNNHHTIVVRYRKAPGKDGERGGKVVVGFEVYTKSVGPDVKKNADGCPANLHDVEQNFELYLAPNKTVELSPGSSYYVEDDDTYDDEAKLTIPYSYSVYFREDTSIEWHTRWDLYFVNQEDGHKIHWLAIVNSLIICGVLTGVVFMVVAKTIRSDIRGYKARSADVEAKRRTKATSATEKVPGLLEQEVGPDSLADMDSDDEALEDITGWKLLHADVFRTPAYGHLLAPLVGSGMQLLFMAIGLVLLSALGVLNPSYRGGFVSFGVGLFVFAGLFSGYFSARVYKTFGGQRWRQNMVITAVLFPGLLFAIVFVLNLFVWAQASSTAIPFGTLIAIIFLWLCVQVPLVYVGSWYGFVRKQGAWEHPTKTSAIPRQIPVQAWYLRGLRTVLLAGLIPFAVIFIELLFVFQSMWQDKSGYYYVFGFLAVVLAILVVTVAEVTVVSIYMQLCAENYHWWWQSFFIGGGSAVWVFMYCVWYYFAKLHITGFLSSMLFFSYSFMACGVYGLLTGTVGFLTAYAFVRRIYGAIKVD